MKLHSTSGTRAKRHGLIGGVESALVTVRMQAVGVIKRTRISQKGEDPDLTVVALLAGFILNVSSELNGLTRTDIVDHTC
nr:hypothetical protein CFP56_16591 [Quercus suber]